MQPIARPTAALRPLILRTICLGLTLSALSLLAATGYSQPAGATYQVKFAVSNEQDMLVNATTLEPKLDFKETVMPANTNFSFTVTRIFPVLESRDNLSESLFLLQTFRMRRDETDRSVALNSYQNMGPGLGHYRFRLAVGEGQHPSVSNQLTSAQYSLQDEHILFLGAKSEVFERVGKETVAFLDIVDDMLAEYSRSLPESVDYDNPKGIQVIQQQPADAAAVRKAIQGIGQDQASRPKALTVPAFAPHIQNLRSGMVGELLPDPNKPSPTPRPMDRNVALLQVYFLRTALLNLHFFLKDAYLQVDPTFEALLERPDAKLRAAVEKEWAQQSESASRLWADLRDNRLNGKFIARNEAMRNVGFLFTDREQVEANGVAFLRLVREENFLDTVQGYIDALNELHLAYVERMDKGKENVDTAKIGRIKRRIEELDAAIRDNLRIRGDIPRELPAEEE